MVHPHFQDSRFAVVPKAEHRHGQTDSVVEILRRFFGTVRRLQNGGNHFLRRRLADAAGNAYAFQRQRSAVRRSDLLQRGDRVPHINRGNVWRKRLGRQHRGRALFQRVPDKIVTVAGPGKRRKQFAGLQASGVKIRAVERPFRKGCRNRAATPLRSLPERYFSISHSAAATSSRSSRWTFLVPRI